MPPNNEQEQIWNELDALHKAWIDRGVSVANVVALYATFLSGTATMVGMDFNTLASYLGTAYAKCMSQKLDDMVKKTPIPTPAKHTATCRHGNEFMECMACGGGDRDR